MCQDLQTWYVQSSQQSHGISISISFIDGIIEAQRREEIWSQNWYLMGLWFEPSSVLFHSPFCWAPSNLKKQLSFQNLLSVSLFSSLFLSFPALHHPFLSTTECDLLTLFQTLSPSSFLSLCFPPPQWLTWSLKRIWGTFKSLVLIIKCIFLF